MNSRHTLAAGIALASAAFAPGAANAQSSQWYYNSYDEPSFGCVNVSGFPAVAVNTGRENTYGDRIVIIVPTSLVGRYGVDMRRYNELVRDIVRGDRRASEFEQAARDGEVPFQTTMSGSSTSIDMHSGHPRPFTRASGDESIIFIPAEAYSRRSGYGAETAPADMCRPARRSDRDRGERPRLPRPWDR